MNYNLLLSDDLFKKRLILNSCYRIIKLTIIRHISLPILLLDVMNSYYAVNFQNCSVSKARNHSN